MNWYQPRRQSYGELVGEVEKAEPEGEAVVVPHGEATTHSSGSTPPLFSFFSNFV